MRRILIIDDDERIRSLLAEYLGGRGYHVTTVPDGTQALTSLRTGSFDLAVLDVMMPGMDGLAVCREVRTFSEVPIIMLTARGDDIDRIVGLELGADDYIAKPFNPRELVARIEAVLRRALAPPTTDASLVAGALRIDTDRRLVTLADHPIDLTTTEFEILRTLVANAGRVIQRERLMELARGSDYAAFDRSVDVHVSHLRKKLGDDSRSPTYIKTVRGVGYLVPQNPGTP